MVCCAGTERTVKILSKAALLWRLPGGLCIYTVCFALLLKTLDVFCKFNILAPGMSASELQLDTVGYAHE